MLVKLVEVVGDKAELVVFPPITVPPEQMVSNELLATIRSCDSLVHFVSGSSRSSPWVELETDYALRCGLPVYEFDPSNGSVVKDDSDPMDLRIFANYTARDKDVVKRLVDVMSKERYFDIFFDQECIQIGTDWAEAISHGLQDRVKRGGYIVSFLSKGSWGKSDMRSFGSRRSRIMLVILDDSQLAPELIEFNPIRLCPNNTKDIDYRRLDDLIVRLYWLIHRNQVDKTTK